MELVILLVIAAVAAWFFLFRDKKVVEEAINVAPYKIESPVEAATNVVEEATIKNGDVDAPVDLVERSHGLSVTEAVSAPVKPKSKPRAKKKPAKAEETTAPSKPVAVKKPKMTVAK